MEVAGCLTSSPWRMSPWACGLGFPLASLYLSISPLGGFQTSAPQLMCMHTHTLTHMHTQSGGPSEQSRATERARGWLYYLLLACRSPVSLKGCAADSRAPLGNKRGHKDLLWVSSCSQSWLGTGGMMRLTVICEVQ